MMVYIIVVFFCTAAGICDQGSLSNNLARYDTSDDCWAAVRAMPNITTSDGDYAFIGCEPESLYSTAQPGSGFWTTSP